VIKREVLVSVRYIQCLRVLAASFKLSGAFICNCDSGVLNGSLMLKCVLWQCKI
jgi:hypothetical protein